MKKVINVLVQGEARDKHHLLLSSKVVEWKCKMSDVGKSKREDVCFINALGGYCICNLILGISLVRPLLLMFKVLGFS